MTSDPPPSTEATWWSSRPAKRPSIVLTEHIAHNVEMIAALSAEQEERVGIHQRAIENITATVGRPSSLYSILAIVAIWVVYNSVASALGLRVLDPPPYFWLQGFVALGSLLMTTMVLTTQNRQSKLADRHAHLDLQMSLLAEQKAAKLIDLIEELRRDLPSVQDREDFVAQAMAKAVDPKEVVSVLEDTLEAIVDSEEHSASAQEPRRSVRTT